jgi:AcrR family transcriptional regulator
MALTAKGRGKKAYILENAAAVFMRNGYTAVTMKDIVEECGISRGGLYKYYSSTREIFLDILSTGQKSDSAFFSESRESGKSALEILSAFLQMQKDELLNIQNSLRLAAYEFFLSTKDNEVENRAKRQYANSIAVLTQVLRYGISRNEITKIALDEVEDAAAQIIILLEGLSIVALSKQVSPQLIDGQFDLLIKNMK